MLIDKGLRVLNIEGQEAGSVCSIPEFEEFKNQVYFKSIFSLSELKFELEQYHWDIVFSDHPSLDALNIVKQSCERVPFVLIVEKMNEETVIDMMKAGVEDIVVRSRFDRMIPTIKRIIRKQERKNKQKESQKMARDAFAAKEQMLAIVSHDIKNPLSAIQLEAQMLLRAVERSGKSLLAEEVKIQANRILKTTERMKILISDLLDKNKSENSLSHIQKNEINAYKLIQDVVDASRPLIQEKDIIIRLAVRDNAHVCIDRNKIYQVFSNLLNNAVKFTPPGGMIQVSMDDDEHDYIFSVSDSGPGLKDKELNKVFEKYWTGNGDDGVGTGLGLFICKTIVEAHHGHISVENLPELGASFKFTIPKDHSGLAQVRVVTPENSKNKRKKIYVVDDDEDLREVISWALGKEGYSIHSFRCPHEALDALNRDRFVPELIVVDFHMDGMNGGDFVMKKNEILRAKSCPVIMISASPQQVMQEIPAIFYKEIITKPIDLEGLVTNVRKFIQ